MGALKSGDKQRRGELSEHGFLKCASCPHTSGLVKRTRKFPLIRAGCMKQKKPVLAHEAANCVLYDALARA